MTSFLVIGFLIPRGRSSVSSDVHQYVACTALSRGAMVGKPSRYVVRNRHGDVEQPDSR